MPYVIEEKDKDRKNKVFWCKECDEWKVLKQLSRHSKWHAEIETKATTIRSEMPIFTLANPVMIKLLHTLGIGYKST